MIDHQWDGKVVPEENVSIAHHIATGVSYLITKIHRYNRSPSKLYQFACSVVNLVTGKSGVADVWYEQNPIPDSFLQLNDGLSFLLLSDGVSFLIIDDQPDFTWKCDTYERIHYRDYDGVTKGL